MNAPVATPAFAHFTAPKPIPSLALDHRARFDARVDHRGDQDCWPWLGSIGNAGYGKFCIGKRTYIASRMAAFYAGLPVNDGGLVCHKCDNRPCCNPAHLFIGSYLDNMVDMTIKGRAANHSGVRNSGAKLTEEQVRAIRVTTENHPVVAARFGISITAVSQIKNRRRWRHI